jgi:hypothetical protein
MNSDARKYIPKVIARLEHDRFPVLIPEGYNPKIHAACAEYGLTPLFQPDPDRLSLTTCTVAVIVDLMFHEQPIQFRNPSDIPKIIDLLSKYIEWVNDMNPEVAKEDIFTQRAVAAVDKLRVFSDNRVLPQSEQANKSPSILDLLRMR